MFSTELIEEKKKKKTKKTLNVFNRTEEVDFILSGSKNQSISVSSQMFKAEAVLF